jgi:cholest-4-en-3-one 26-monooxygenase
MKLSDIDVVSNSVYLNDVPYEQFAFLRRHAPVFRQPVPDPDVVDAVWVITRYADVLTVSLDTETFSSTDGVTLRRERIKEGVRVDAGNFINQDDPEHGRLRGLVSLAFTPRVVRSFERHYRELAGRVIEKAIVQETFDFVSEVSSELPLLAICELLGVPSEDRSRVFGWSNAIIGAEDPEYAGSRTEAASAVTELGAYALQLIDDRRGNPRDDILSALANASGDDRLTDPELEGFTLLLLVAGNETTRNNISHGLIALMEHPEQMQALRNEPSLLSTAVEEITRWASPVNYMARTVVRDTEVNGQSLRAGDRVAMFYASANRDEDVFADAEVFDVERTPNKQVAFGVGKHFCLGANLARIETRVMFSELLSRIVDVELAGPIERLRSSFIHGVKHLPVRVVPA